MEMLVFYFRLWTCLKTVHLKATDDEDVIYMFSYYGRLM